jgi:competence protein ComEA
MMQTLLRYRGYIVLTCVYAILFGAYVLYDRRPQPEPIAITTPTATGVPTPAALVVHVVGAVAQPGVYTLPAGSRLAQAVQAAGGLTSEADAASVNLADYARDGQQVLIPVLGVSPPPSPTPGSQTVSRAGASVSLGGLVNLNTATLAELDTLPGIGPVYAQRIIDYRLANGPFTDPAQVMDVKGIGPATYARIQDLVTVR